MADKRDEEGSSSHGTERVSHDEDALFKAEMVSFMETFQQLSKHPKMQELLKASKSPTQTQRASSQSLQSPRQSRSGHTQRKETSKEQRSNDTKGKGRVVEQPPVSIGHRQPSTHGLVNGQDSNEHTMRQTIPLPMSNAGCFGGGSVFQAMIRPSPALHGFMPDNAYGAVPPSGNNPMNYHKEVGMVEFQGLLKVRVIKGTYLAIRDVKTSDPYVVVSIGHQTMKTRVINSNLNPIWNEELMLSVPSPPPPLKVQVFDKDLLSADDSMGEAEVDLQPLVSAASLHEGITTKNRLQVGKWLATNDNALVEDSLIWLKEDGHVTQGISLRLQNVESGLLDLDLEWVPLNQ
ncbi:hypothetical protein L7F22_042592 [Adiantum nelumboides]|nr:hypothetical protein [Adiantum nelumboides]